MQVGNIKNFTRETELDLDEYGKLKIAYHPAAISPDMFKSLAVEEDSVVLRGLAEIASEALTWWDMWDGEEQLDPTADLMESLGLRFVMKFMFALQADQAPNPRRASTSAAPSGQAARSVPSHRTTQNGSLRSGRELTPSGS